jgi:DNA-binding MurR/RpiR family transcriptional regulator
LIITTIGSKRAEPPLDDRVAAASGLTPTERRIAEFLRSERERVPFLTADDVAGSVGVSRLSVLRTARTLGYAGLAELKRELARALQQATAARRFADTAAHLDDRGDRPLDRALAFQMEALQETRRTTDPRSIRRAVDLLAKADRIAVYGQETAASLGDAFVQRLRRHGWQALAFKSAGVALAEELMQLRSGDVVVAIADADDAQISVILDDARSKRVPCVLVTNSLGLAFRGQRAVVLSARRGPAGDAPTSAGENLVLEALTLGLAARRTHEVVTSRRRLFALRERLAPADSRTKR